MTLSDPFASRARLAWLIMFFCFLTFVSICLAIPLGLNYYVQHSTQPLTSILSANRGTVAIVQPDGESTAVRDVDPERVVTPASRIVTNATDTAQLQISDPSTGRPLVRGQVYGNSNITLSTAETPSFGFSTNHQDIQLDLTHGRVRLILLPAVLRPYDTIIHTPHGKIALQSAGQYSIDVNETQTQIAVQNGMATLSNPSLSSDYEGLALSNDQRGLLLANQPPEGPLTNERNLIQNSNFQQGFEHWLPRDWNIELADQPSGKTEIAEVQGESTLRFERVGIGHADAAVRQLLNQDVTDYDSLQLLLDLRIAEQTLGVCGTVGSECPLTIRLEYEDADGARRVWQQGFYASGDITVNTPDTCINCQPPNVEHAAIPGNRLYTYEVDLLESLAFYSAPPPRYLNSISLIGAGHTFNTEIANISLLARE
jgi:hypothetical protein